MTDKISGNHYDFPKVSETIELIEDVVTRENLPRRAAYSIGNALKYICRAGKKPGEEWMDDIRKAENYLHRATHGEWVGKEGR